MEEIVKQNGFGFGHQGTEHVNNDYLIKKYKWYIFILKDCVIGNNSFRSGDIVIAHGLDQSNVVYYDEFKSAWEKIEREVKFKRILQ